MNKQFQKEQNELLKNILDLRFFEPWSSGDEDITELRQDSSLEIFITNKCNQNCSYCYLKKYPELYPKEISNEKTILNNLKLLYDYLLSKRSFIPKIEFFSGEIWGSDFGLEILEITKDYLKKGLGVGFFMIASNCSFVLDNYYLSKIQGYINTFKDLNTPLTFSISVDGKVVETLTRPFNDNNLNTLKTEDYYWEMIFSFAKYNNFYFHPMVSADNIKYWKENHKWWIKELKKYHMPTDLMMLEVRNADWSEENMEQYCDFLDYLMDDYLQNQCKNNVKEFTERIFGLRGNKNSLSGYVPFCLPEGDSFIGCSCALDLTVRLGDLAIAPCHRTAYNKYLYGRFVVEDNQIVDIEANNPQMAIKVLASNINTSAFGCNNCLYQPYCLKGCFGSQLETMGDPFIPIPNICEFFKRKYDFILKKYKELGVIDYLKTFTKYEIDYEEVKNFLKFYKKWEARDVE